MLEFQAGKHPVILTIKIIVRLKLRRTAGNDRNTMFQGACFAVCLHGGFEITDKTVTVLDVRI